MDDEVQDIQVEEPELNESNNEETLTNEPQETEEVSEEPVEVTEEDEDEQPIRVNAPDVQAPPFDFSKIPANENGELDAQALAQAFQEYGQEIAKTSTQNAANMLQEMEERRQEERQWNKAFEKYPDLKNDKSLAEEVQALRFGLFANEINSGKQGNLITPTKAFERLNSRFAAKKVEGIKQATENTRVEESVYVEPTSNAGSVKESDEDALFKQMRSPDRTEADQAGFDFLKKRLFG